jgi:hypothetical protein
VRRILESELQEAYREGVLKNSCMAGEFHVLERGNTAISWTVGTVNQVTAVQRWQTLYKQISSKLVELIMSVFIPQSRGELAPQQYYFTFKQILAGQALKLHVRTPSLSEIL